MKSDLQIKFEKETGYFFGKCDKCVYEHCKNTQICNYWKTYAYWLQKYIEEL